MSLISIFVPVYNAEKYIRKCLDSILAQTLQDFELFIHDDGSTDRSYEICQEYAQNDNRIILDKGVNGTSSESQNKFVENAKSEYVGFVDNDDYIDPDYFRILYEAIKRNECDLAVASYTLVDDNNQILDWYTPKLNNEILNGKDICRRFLTSLDIEGFRWNKLFKRSVLINNNITIKNVYPGDIPFVFEYLQIVSTCVLVDDNGYYYRQRENSDVSTKKVGNVDGMINVFNRIASQSNQLKLTTEGEYYYLWRIINCLYYAYKDRKKYSDETRIGIRTKYKWEKWTKKSLLHVLSLLKQYDNKRDNKYKFAIKTLIVRLYYR